ncbi:putative dna repair protein [Botrytis fragariae]|uniref:Putative dna repair protein n=1 Tax=Botrytis fragariae TaxID=1964551 RepID=A0A8H6ASF4_9HELO|nr:putative dna repair protein [Botrytis fragariae]KAF5872966.1 putative dna repair protein [Botrytis fragariae]
MPTRAATKAAEAAAALSSAAATLSSPPTTPADSKQILKNVATGSSTKSRKRAPPKKKAKSAAEPMTGGWDVLPHGMGQKGDLLDDNFGNAGTKVTPTTPKKTTRARVTKTAVKTSIKDEDEEKPLNLGNSVIPDLLEDIKEEEPKKKRSPRKKKVVDVSTEVDGSPAKPVKEKKKSYGIVFGETPFPDHVSPTAQEAETVNSLLTALHGEVKPPDTVPAPSETVTGCGEVPDVLDATMRTLLSAATTAGNANKSMAGLKAEYGLRTSGKGAGSVSWEAVHASSREDVEEAIRSGGLAKVKAGYIKAILQVVFDKNSVLLETLLKEADTDVPVPFVGKVLETKEQKEAEIKSLRENMLSLDYVHSLDKPAAMRVLMDLPGIGVKTAACVALFCLGRPSFAVDTHVWRHCVWLGWVPEKASRDQTFSHCEVRIPDHLKYSLHQLFLRHGKTCGRCRAATTEGSVDWESTVCPIEHLVNRTGDKKQPGFRAGKKAVVKKVVKKVGKGSKKRKRNSEDSDEESEAEVDTENDMEFKEDKVEDESDIEIEADTESRVSVQTD